MMMRGFLSACALALSMFASAAHANVIYTFTGEITGPTASGNPLAYTSTITVTDAGFSSGQLNFSVPPSIGCGSLGRPPCSIVGDYSGFVSLTDNQGGGVNFNPLIPSAGPGTMSVNVLLGETLSGGITIHGESEDVVFSGSSGSWLGTYNSDRLSCNTLCTLSGQWSAAVFVPEPSSVSLTLVMLGVFGTSIGASRRRRRVSSPSGSRS